MFSVWGWPEWLGAMAGSGRVKPMFKRSMLLCAAWAIAGCGQNEGGAGNQGATALRLVGAGDGRACVEPSVLETLYRTIQDAQLNVDHADHWTPEYLARFDRERQVHVEQVTLAGADQQTRRVTCEGRFVVAWDGRGASVPVIYRVQPALDTHGVIVTVDDMRAPNGAYAGAREAFYGAVIYPAFLQRQQMGNAETAHKRSVDLCRRLDALTSAGQRDVVLEEGAEIHLRDLQPPLTSEQAQSRQCLEQALSRAKAMVVPDEESVYSAPLTPGPGAMP